MSDIAIRVENLGKQYRLGAPKKNRTRYQYKSLRDSLTNAAAIPFRALRSPSTKKHAHARRIEDSFWALRDISFDLKQGEVVGIIGRNGAGKSTLLKILSRITEPTTGRAQIRGRVASLLEVGTGFHPELTGRENIYMNGAILGMTRVEIWRKFDEIVAFAEVDKFLDTPVKHYSSGMYVRLAFAVAAHLEQEILIVDEVLAVGDAEFQKKCLGKMHDVSRTGRTVLFVSHNMSAVRTLCSRATLLSSGTLITAGDVDRVIDSYLNTDLAHTEATWQRNAGHATAGPIYFKRIKAALQGSQPRMQLEIQTEIVCEASSPLRTFISVDLCDGLGTPLMQAIPVGEPFLLLCQGVCCLQLKVDLPPLVPGRYLADLWIGTHYTSTLDYVKKVVAITVDESPMPNRTFPHHADHGFMIAPSRCDYPQFGKHEIPV